MLRKNEKVLNTVRQINLWLWEIDLHEFLSKANEKKLSFQAIERKKIKMNDQCMVSKASEKIKKRKSNTFSEAYGFEGVIMNRKDIRYSRSRSDVA